MRTRTLQFMTSPHGVHIMGELSELRSLDLARSAWRQGCIPRSWTFRPWSLESQPFMRTLCGFRDRLVNSLQTALDQEGNVCLSSWQYQGLATMELGEALGMFVVVIYLYLWVCGLVIVVVYMFTCNETVLQVATNRSTEIYDPDQVWTGAYERRSRDFAAHKLLVWRTIIKTCTSLFPVRVGGEKQPAYINCLHMHGHFRHISVNCNIHVACPRGILTGQDIRK